MPVLQIYFWQKCGIIYNGKTTKLNQADKEIWIMATEKWSVERAWEWHNQSKWLRGCNFIPSDCCNRIDFWQSLNWEKHIATADAELELAASAGLNSVRMILEFTVLDEEHDSFMQRFEEFLTVCDKHNISVMVCFGNDCTVPKNAEYRAPHLGVQEFDWGYHGGRKILRTAAIRARSVTVCLMSLKLPKGISSTKKRSSPVTPMINASAYGISSTNPATQDAERYLFRTSKRCLKLRVPAIPLSR